MRGGSALRVPKRHKKQERLEARVSPAQKRIEMLTLCDEAREVFVNALMNPPAPNKAMRAAAARYRRHRSA